MDYTVTLLMSEFVTHDVKRFMVSKPDGFEFAPGQGVELAIDTPDWKDEGHPFTPTSLTDDRIIEFTIKSYPEHKGVTQQLHRLRAGAQLLMSDPFGTISYQGPGVFIAGGAGLTPFLAILRELAARDQLDDHALIFANKTPADVICEKELRHYLGERCVLLCSDTRASGYEYGRIDQEFLADRIDDFDQHFYVCGPDGFMDVVNASLKELGADPQALVFEQ